MARPKKSGLDYFPHDTQARNDHKLKLLCIEHGNDGYSTYFRILEIIYSDGKSELNLSDKRLFALVARECFLTEEKLQSVIDSCCALELFSKETWDAEKVICARSIVARIKAVKGVRAKDLKRKTKTEEKAGEFSDRKTPGKLPENESIPPEKGGKETKENKTKLNETKVNILLASLGQDLEKIGMVKALEDWRAHRAEIKKPLTPKSLSQLLENYHDRPDELVRDIKKSIQNGWQGVFSEKTNQAPQRETNFDRNMRILRAS